jgi:hypothetical protein
MILFTAAVLAVFTTPPSSSLRGSVVDAEGKPVKGATVWVLERPSFGSVQVVAEGLSDEQGRFALDCPTDLADEYRIHRAESGSESLSPLVSDNTNPQIAPQGITFWAFRPGMRVAVREFTGGVPGPDQPVRLVLRPPARTEIEVNYADLRPVAGARIRISRLTSDIRAIPKPLADCTELATDARGVAVLDAFAAERVAELEVKASGHGIQRCALLPTVKGHRLVWLAPVAKVTGQLTADDPHLLEGWSIWAATSPVDKSAGADISFAGVAVATTDGQGRFEIPAIAEGYLTLSCRPRNDASYRVKDLPQTLVRADRPNEIKLAVDRAYRVEGTVLDRQSGAGIAGVRVTTNMQQAGYQDHCFTDENGRYAMHLLPAQYQLRFVTLPRAYTLTPNAEYRQINVVPGEKPTTVDAAEFIKAEPPLRGSVVDESGQPVAGASVAGVWEVWLANYYGLYESLATTDSSGTFRLERIPPLVEVKLTAKHGSMATPEPLLVWPSHARSVTLRITQAATSALRGRVLMTDGSPISNALVRVQSRKNQGQRGFVFGPVDFDRGQEIRTAADGTFQTPRELELALDYRVEVIADGFVSESSEFVKPASELIILPDLLLRRALKLRTVTGRVVDRQGHPIPSATVLQSGDGPRRSRAGTDALGRFQISGVTDQPAFLFAEKPGFRFGGTLTGTGDRAVDVILDRADQPPARVLKTLAWPASREEERALARSVLEPIAVPSDLRQRIPNDFQLRKVLRPLAWVDPPRLLAVLASPAIMRDESILDATAIALWEMRGPQAVDMVDSEPDPCARAYGLLALEKVAPADLRKLHIDLLARAAHEGARVTDPGEKLRLLGRAADRLIEMGESERVVPILREGWKLAQTIKRDQYGQSIAEFAPALSTTGFKEAVALVQGKDGSTPLLNNPMYANSILGEIAWRIAASNPAEAERLFTQINAAVVRNGLERHLLRACSRMAPRDLDRASRLAATLAQPPQPNNNVRNRSRNRFGPGLAIYGELVVAKAIAESKPADARNKVEEAISELRRRAFDEPSQAGELNPARLIAGSLPLVEQLMPERVGEYLWLALACRPPRGDEPDLDRIKALASLAGIVARYDPTIAEQIARPVFDQVPVPSRPALNANKWFGFENVFQSLACLDPRRAAELVGRLPDDDKLPDLSAQQMHGALGKAAIRRVRVNGAVQYPIKSASRIQLAEALLLPIDRRRLEVESGIATPWLLDPAGESAP